MAVPSERPFTACIFFVSKNSGYHEGKQDWYPDGSKIWQNEDNEEILNYLYERVGWVMGDWGLYFKENVKLRQK